MDDIWCNSWDCYAELFQSREKEKPNDLFVMYMRYNVIKRATSDQMRTEELVYRTEMDGVRKCIKYW